MSVYFARRGKLIKIGWSRNVRYRVSELKAKLIGTVPGDRAEEKVLHARFAHLRVRGEWFKKDEELLNYIRNSAQTHEPDWDNIQTAIRLPRALLNRVDAISARMSVKGIEITRSDVLRISMFKGIDILESESKSKRKTNR